MSYKLEDTPLYKLLLTGKRHRLPKGEIVHGFQDRALIHLIKSGYIKSYLIQSDGTRSTRVIYGPNYIVPLTPVYNMVFEMQIYTGPETYYYETMTDVDLYSLDRDALKEALAKDPLLYKDLFYAAGVRLNSYIHRLEDASITGSHRRVAHLLVYLSNVFGSPTKDGGLMIDLPLTQQTIAEILGLARETVTHSVVNLREKGLLVASDKKIILPDPEKLQREAYK